jgi:hypothetical protein
VGWARYVAADAHLMFDDADFENRSTVVEIAA